MDFARIGIAKIGKELDTHLFTKSILYTKAHLNQIQ
jgi:hypothetical protein